LTSIGFPTVSASTRLQVAIIIVAIKKKIPNLFILASLIQL